MCATTTFRRWLYVDNGQQERQKKIHNVRRNTTSELNNLSFSYVSSLIAVLLLLLLRFLLYFPS